MKNVLEQIYAHAPIWLQNVMCSVKGWTILRRRYAKGFFQELERLERRVDKPDELLNAFLKLARGVPAYAAVFAAGKGTRLEDFPIIDKAYVKAHYNDFINREYHGPTLVVHTSGTTGNSLDVLQSQGFEHRQWATWWRYREELGIKYGTWYGWFGCGEMIVPIQQENPPFWRVEAFGRRVMFGTYHLNFDNVDVYAKEITQRNLKWLHGNSSRLCYLSRLIMERGIAPIRCVKFVTTASENLLPNNVAEIQRAFPNAMVRNHYGQTEGVANFSQTKEGYWKIDDDFAHVEFIPIDPANPERCRIVGTNFSNPVFPLIRYDMGDIAIVKWQEGKPQLQYIEGRENERVTLCNGMLVNSMLSYDIFGESPNVREAQIRVLEKGHSVELLVVKGARFSDRDESDILARARRYLKDEIKLSIRYTDQIPRAKSGKFRAVVEA